MRIATVVGARPQSVKAAAVSRRIAERRDLGITEILIHTGQHFDPEMSAVFFSELAIPRPAIDLGVGAGAPSAQTAAIMTALEPRLAEIVPDIVVVYGDTNSTLAGALAAAKLDVPVAHVEAGCRSHDRAMPEEINRVLTDHAASLLFCATPGAVRELAREGLTRGVHQVGDVMLDLLRRRAPEAGRADEVLATFQVARKRFVLATVHRAGNTDRPDRLLAILQALDRLPEPVLFPIHPRTRQAIARLGWAPAGRLRIVDPVGYLEMLALVQGARVVVTDSGGVQKEAFFLETPCVTLRETTEWPETVDAGWNRLVGADPDAIRDAAAGWQPAAPARTDAFGDGTAADRIGRVLEAWR